MELWSPASSTSAMAELGASSAETKMEELDHHLWLVIDLDHTLLHTGKIEDLSPDDSWHIHHDFGADRGLYAFPDHPSTLTKIRPFAHAFLQQAAQMFHLCVCTFGSRDYVGHMLSLLDPDGRLFHRRIVCREDLSPLDDDGSMLKRLDAILPCGPPHPSKVLILDDSPHVWPSQEAASNLIAVPPYFFFPTGGRRRRSHSRPSPSPSPTSALPLLRSAAMDESVNLSPLARLLPLLKDIHHHHSSDADDARVLLRDARLRAHAQILGSARSLLVPPAPISHHASSSLTCAPSFSQASSNESASLPAGRCISQQQQQQHHHHHQ